MSEMISIMFDENGLAKEYDDTFDITIHCESEEEHNKVLEILNRRWIPVSERLPEKGGAYLVTTKWKGSYSGDVYTETNMAVYKEKQKEWDCAGIIAWMPLPEPYEPTN